MSNMSELFDCPEPFINSARFQDGQGCQYMSYFLDFLSYLRPYLRGPSGMQLSPCNFISLIQCSGLFRTRPRCIANFRYQMSKEDCAEAQVLI